jgi:hypothetical protein
MLFKHDILSLTGKNIGKSKEKSMSENFDKIDEVIATAMARRAATEGAASDFESFQFQRAENRKKIKSDREIRKLAKPDSHMKKVANAASKLPQMNDYAQTVFDELTVNLSAEQLTAIALHLQHHNRIKSTQRSVGSAISVGSSVKIIGGDPRFHGMSGTVIEARRIRCFVDVPGFKKPVYCFISDVEPLAQLDATGTDN